MKNYLFLISSFVAFSFISCDKDEPNDNTDPVSEIVAKWEITSVSTSVKDDATKGQTFDTTISQSLGAGELIFDFRSNGDLIVTEQGTTTTQYYTYDAPTLKIYESKDNLTDEDLFYVTISGTTAVIKTPEYKQEGTDNQGNPATLLMQNTYNAKKMP